jgi:hypothetical protein
MEDMRFASSPLGLDILGLNKDVLILCDIVDGITMCQAALGRNERGDGWRFVLDGLSSMRDAFDADGHPDVIALMAARDRLDTYLTGQGLAIRRGPFGDLWYYLTGALY